MLQSGPYRFFFFSSDRGEPPHVHVAREGKLAKFWLSPVRMAVNLGFGAREVARLAAVARQDEAELVEAWNDYFGNGNSKGAKGPGH